MENTEDSFSGSLSSAGSHHRAEVTCDPAARLCDLKKILNVSDLNHLGKERF